MSRNSRQTPTDRVTMSSPIYIEPILFRILSAHREAPFTVSELTAAYRVERASHGRNDRTARQFVHRNIHRLTKLGVLQSLPTSSLSKAIRYRYIGLDPQDAEPDIPTPTEVRTTLRDKLAHHRVELLTTLGEREAYEELCAELPGLRESAQAHYNEARDRSSKLLGRIRALEALIDTQPTP